MLSKVFENLGEVAQILSPDKIKTGDPKARVSLIKNKARVQYNDRFLEVGRVSGEIFLYIGSCQRGGDTITVDGFVLYKGDRFLVVRCEEVSVKDYRVMWAVLKKLPPKEDL